MTKRILLTGGGSTGHVAVNLALIPQFVEEDWDIHYIGSHAGIESKLMRQQQQVHYIGIASGKLRRYWSLSNLSDPFRVLLGVAQAYRHIRRIKPHVVFSKGGFVSVPVVLAARLNGIPVVIHESDLTPGLANRLVLPYVQTICTTFEETKPYIRSSEKVVHLGAIVRKELFHSSKEEGYRYCQLNPSKKPVIVVMGGSLGARAINEAVRKALPELVTHYQIVHLCGAGQLDKQQNHPSYRQYEYLSEELPHVLAMGDMVITRAGSNSIFEMLALGKPMLLIPLPLSSSRGDQLLNAESFKKQGYGEVLQEEELTAGSLVRALERLQARYPSIVQEMRSAQARDRTLELVTLLKQAALD